MSPYFLMAILYLSLAVLAALDSSLASLNLVPWFNGLRWLRVHLITLGVVSEVAFGLLPILVAKRVGQPWPRTRWDIWLTLNVGLLTLLVGIPPINAVLILTGGTLIFTATTLLLIQLKNLGLHRRAASGRASRKFYLAALSYLLLGIFLGTGLWLGWGPAIGLDGPKEVHVHTNLWGFTALLFAGLLVDLYPRFAGRSLAWPRSIDATFWLMTLGALGLVLGPWLKIDTLSMGGLVVHSIGTILLLANLVKPLLGERRAWSPGMSHLVTSYFWLLAPGVIAPMIVVKAPWFPVATVESSGAPMLVYGWVLQFGYALIPYLFARLFLPDQPARLGGSWFSLATAHAGGIFLAASLFIAAFQAPLGAIAFALWVLSTGPIAVDLWRIVRAGLAQIEQGALGATGS